MIGGNALNGKAGSPGAKPVMNWAAREKTWLKSRGVSNGLGNGDCLSWARIYEEWRDSTVRMEPAAAR